MREVNGSLGRSLVDVCNRGGDGAWWSSALAQRAASEGPRLGSWHVSACQWVGGWERRAQWKIIQPPSPERERVNEFGGSMYIHRHALIDSSCKSAVRLRIW